MQKRVYLCVLAGVLTLESGALIVHASEVNSPVVEKTELELSEEGDTEQSENKNDSSFEDEITGEEDSADEHSENTSENIADEGMSGDLEENVAEEVAEEAGTGTEMQEVVLETYEANVSPVEAFVIRFYTKALERQADQSGVSYWVNALKSGVKNGAGIADAFIFGEEFQLKKVDNEKFIDIMYQVFMDREADNGGKNYWIGLLNQGMSRREACSKFIKSAEFSQICSSYGIRRGELSTDGAENVPSDNTNTVNEAMIRFVRQAYENILGRTADEEGLSYYASLISKGNLTGAGLLEIFLKSQEFSQANLSNEEIVKIMYRACLGREADARGMSYWVSLLNQGGSETYIASKFSGSQEFSILCQNAGITKGSVEIKEYRDQTLSMTGYVYRCYEKTLDREPDVNGLNYWCQGLLTGKMSAEDVAKNFVFSQEFTNKNLSNEEFIKVLYRVFMGREADASGLQYWTGRMSAGRNKKAVFYGFARSQEFNQILSGFGLSISNGPMEGAVYEDGTSSDTGNIKVEGTYLIMGSPSVSVQQMVNYFNYVMPTYPSYYQGTEIETVEKLCQVYYEEAQAEGVRVEVAFCQAMLETGFLKYGGDVDISQYNFAGLGATGNGAQGNAFGSPREGIRAQIQHLKAYASTAPLNQPCVDVRFGRVKRGTAVYLEWLGIKENPYGGGWATAQNYGIRIKKMIDKLKTF